MDSTSHIFNQEGKRVSTFNMDTLSKLEAETIELLAIYSKQKNIKKLISFPNVTDDLIKLFSNVNMIGFAKEDKGRRAKTRYIRCTATIPEQYIQEVIEKGDKQGLINYYKYIFENGIPITLKLYGKKIKIHSFDYENEMERLIAEILLHRFYVDCVRENANRISERVNKRFNRAKTQILVCIGYIVCGFMFLNIMKCVSYISWLTAAILFISKFTVDEKSNYRKEWKIDEI